MFSPRCFVVAALLTIPAVASLFAADAGQIDYPRARGSVRRRGQANTPSVGFGVLTVRGVLYTLTHSASALIAIQILDGVANAIFIIVSILVTEDRTQGTGRFNVAAGALATMVGIGAAQQYNRRHVD
jgi:hypothetical protein